MGGAAFAQIIIILASPIILRLYSPDAFGLYALYISIISIISVVACLTYDLTIVLPDKDEDAANLLALSLIAAIITSIIITFLIWLSNGALTRLLNAPGLQPYILLIPVTSFLGGVFSALNYWYIRNKRFGKISIAKIASSISTYVTQLTAGFAGFATGGSLIGSNLMGYMASSLILCGQIWRNDRSILKEYINARGIAAGLIRYKKFPMYTTWAYLLNGISNQLPTFVFAAFFSTTIVGYYALGTMVLQFPVYLIVGAISQVLFQRASVAKYEGRLKNVAEDIFRLLIIFGAFPFLVLSLIGEEIFAVVFGEQWATAGIYAQILAVMMLAVFITSPLSILIDVLERQRACLIFNIILFFARSSAIIAGCTLGKPLVALILFSSAGTIIYASQCIWILSITGVQIKVVFKELIPYLIYFVPTLGLIFMAKFVFYLDPQMILFMAFISSSIYYAKVFTTMNYQVISKTYLEQLTDSGNKVLNLISKR